MGGDRAERLTSGTEVAWPVVKQFDVARSGCLRQQKVCHRRARLMHRTNVASMSPCCIQASRLALTVTVCTSRALRSRNSVSHNEGFSSYMDKTGQRSNCAVRICACH